MGLEISTVAPPRPATSASRISGGAMGTAGSDGVVAGASADLNAEPQSSAASSPGSSSPNPESTGTQGTTARNARNASANKGGAVASRDHGTTRGASHSTDDSSERSPDAASQQATSADASPANGAGNGRPSKSVSARAKNAKSSTPANQAQMAAGGPGQTNIAAAGLSFTQTLARSLNATDTAGPGVAAGPSAATGPAVAGTPGTAGDPGTSAGAAAAGTADGSLQPSGNSGVGSGTDPSAIAQALSSQSLVAALGLPSTVPLAAGVKTTVPTAQMSSGTSIDSVSLSRRSSIQELVQLLAQNIANDSNGHAIATDPTGAAGAGGAADTTGAAGSTTGAASTADARNLPLPGAGGSADAAVQVALGVASHFPAQHTTTSSTTGELRAPVGSPAWNDELGGQLTLMASQGLESASLRLSPEHLGPLEVHISVQNGDASVWFGATQPDTRAALEQALPRLREMFASQGLTLADSGVSREPPRNPAHSSGQSVARISAVEGAELTVSSPVRVSLGLVDTYA